VDRISIGPDMLKEMEQQVIQIKQNLKTAQDRQKSYADKENSQRVQDKRPCLSQN
jgi:hypothetical protein